jgi:hypothetical protein
MAPTFKSWPMGDETYVNEILRTTINDVNGGRIQPASALKTAEEEINKKFLTYKK